MNQDSSIAMKIRAASLRHRIRETVSTEILDAAEAVAAEGGLAAASLAAIAERAGVAVGTIYNHFTDREELFDALMKRRKEELYTSIDDALKSTARAPFAEQLRAYVAAVLAYFDARRAFLRVSLESEHPRPLLVKDAQGRTRPATQPMQERAARVVRAGLREKKLRDGDVELVASVLWSILRGVLLTRIDDASTFVSETDAVVDLFLRGAATR
jgi:AcrR family transcriptional regulator